MSETKSFRTVVVLTAATGIGMGDMTFADVHELISWLSGGQVWTHQLPAVRAEAEAAAQTALGWAWEPFDPQREGHAEYGSRMIAKLGEKIDIAPAAKPFHREDVVMADAVEMMGGDRSKVIVVEAPHV